MKKEFEACEAQQTWTLMKRSELPAGANVLPVKWVFKKKTNEDGVLTQFKARITPKGFRQKEGVDYFEVFAHTGKYKTLRVALALAAKMDMELNQLDVPSAFVRAELNEEVYMEMPDGFKIPDTVCKLEKSLYGLKQSPRNWYKLLSSFIREEMGWAPCVSDPCLFKKHSRTGKQMLLFVFVDDMQGIYHRTDAAEWEEDKRKLTARFETKDLGESTWMLGMRITRDRKARTIKLDQELYVTKALEKYGLMECKTARTPAEVNNGAQEDDRDGGGKPTHHQLYMEKVGTLLYAAISTRPDIGHAVNQLTRHMQAPVERHMKAANRVLRYLAGTKDMGLWFGRRRRQDDREGAEISAYADSDWGSDKSDRKSITGWIAMVNGDPVSWASKKQKVVALSTCEAELYAEASAMQEVLWLRGLLKELELASGEAATIYGDNQSAIATSKNGIRSERTKHVDIKYQFVTDLVDSGKVKLQWIPTQQQHADILTKALAASVFQGLRAKIMTLAVNE
jgi:hypothetical protein